MKRRGVIQAIYKEVMTIPKEEINHSSDVNTSEEALFTIPTDDVSMDTIDSSAQTTEPIAPSVPESDTL